MTRTIGFCEMLSPPTPTYILKQLYRSSTAAVSHLHMLKQAGQRDRKWKDGGERWDWENARSKRKSGKEAPKVVGRLRSRCTKWVAAGSGRASDGRRRGGKKERRRGREAKLMQLLSRTNAFGAAEYRSHISSDCSLQWKSFLQAFTSHKIQHHLGSNLWSAKFIHKLCMTKCHAQKKCQIWAATTRHGLACATYRMHLDHQYFTAAWVPWVTNPPRCEKAFITPLLKLFSVRYVVATPHNCEVVNDHLEPVQENDRAKKRRRREEDGAVDWERARTGRKAINTAIRMRRWWRLTWDSMLTHVSQVAAVHLQMSPCEMLCNCKRSHMVDQMSTNLLRDTQKTLIHRNWVHRV